MKYFKIKCMKFYLPAKISENGELAPKNSLNTSSGGLKTNGNPPIMSKSSNPCVL